MDNPITYTEGDSAWLRCAMGRERVTIVRIDGDRYRVRKGDGKHRTVSRDRLAPTVRPSRIPTGSVARVPSFQRPELVPVAKAKPVRNRKYLDWLRGLPCAFCGQDAQRCEASHHGKHGVGTKADDTGALPACSACHERHHRIGAPQPWLGARTPAERLEIYAVMAKQYRERWK